MSRRDLSERIAEVNSAGEEVQRKSHGVLVSKSMDTSPLRSLGYLWFKR